MDLLNKEITLDSLRDTLVRLEDTITFAIIERAQFCTNKKIYEPGALNFNTGFNGTFLEYFLHEVETVHAKVRRYTSPDEYPFSKDLPDPVIPKLDFPQYLKTNDINLNPKLYNIYTDKIVPKITKPGDDKNYGTCATRDVEVLQALSRRIHYGKFIAEAKFRDPKLQPQYIELIKKKDSVGIEQLLTNTLVEEKLLRRLVKKATIYGGEIDEDSSTTSTTTTTITTINSTNCQSNFLKIQPNVVSEVYKEYIIPLTKEVEVKYLLNRLDE